MFDQLLDPHNLPFSVALILMLLLALIQLIGLGHVFDVDGDLDHGPADLDIDAGLLSLVGIGRLPFLMWLMLFLTLFGLIGLSVQELIAALIGGPLSPWLAAPLTLLPALPVAGLISRPLAAILPRDETTAVSVTSLIGREGEVTIGTAARGSAARVRVKDVHGVDHHVMVEPDNDDQIFHQGERVLLVRQEGAIFRAIGRGDHLLPQLD